MIFTEVPEIRQSNTGSAILDGIEKRMPQSHVYQNPGDRGNWVHEGTHGLNSRLRVATREQDNVLYVLDGKACYLSEPNLRLRDIIPYIPGDCRGGGYQLYLQQQLQSWDDTPTYVLDEWVAYTNGSAYVNESGGSEYLCYERMIEFNAYATALVLAVQAKDPNYKDKDKLIQFVAWNIERTLVIYEGAKNKRPATDLRLRIFKERFYRNDPGQTMED
jgi:hypothetical protein